MCEVMVYRRIKTQKMPTVCHTFTLSPKAGLLSVADFQFHFKISPIVTSPLTTGRLISLSIMSFKKFFWQIIFLLSMINLVVLISLPQCCLCPQIFAEHCQVTLHRCLEHPYLIFSLSTRSKSVLPAPFIICLVHLVN